MRILQIHPMMKSEALSPAAGGMAGASLQLTRLLVERGHEVQVLPIPEGVGNRELWEVAPGRAVEVAAAMHIPGWREMSWLPGALMRLRPRSDGPKNLLYDTFALTALRREVKLFRPQIIHNHLARRPFPRLAQALGLRGNLLLTHHHGEAGDSLEGYDRIVFPSASAQESIAPRIPIPQDRIRHIYNPVSYPFTQCEPAPGNSREGIWFVGAVRHRKGIDLLLDAYRLDHGLWNEPLYICGVGEDADLVQQAVREGIPARWLGHLSQEQLAGKLAAAKLAVVPSRLEGFSIAILEALCCGVPVVGWAPQIKELETFLGIPVGRSFDGRTQTPAELVEIIHDALQQWSGDGGLRPRLATAAREAFSEERYVTAYLDLYRELTGS